MNPQLAVLIEWLSVGHDLGDEDPAEDKQRDTLARRQAIIDFGFHPDEVTASFDGPHTIIRRRGAVSYTDGI